MALFDRFKRKKKAEKKEEREVEPKGEVKEQKPVVSAPAKKEPEKVAKKEVKKEVKKAAAKKPSIRTAPQPPPARPVKKREAKTAPRVLKYPRITEKATYLQAKNQYVFKVFSGATKPEIKKSIEEVYGVDVVRVRVVSVPRKRKRLGRSRGWQSGYKKAIIEIKKGQSIEVLPR